MVVGGVEVHFLVFLNIFPNIKTIPGLKITSKVVIPLSKLKKGDYFTQIIIMCALGAKNTHRKVGE